MPNDPFSMRGLEQPNHLLMDTESRAKREHGELPVNRQFLFWALQKF